MLLFVGILFETMQMIFIKKAFNITHHVSKLPSNRIPQYS